MRPVLSPRTVAVLALCTATAFAVAAPLASAQETVGDPFRISAFGAERDGSARATAPEVATDPGSGVSLVVYGNQPGQREVHGKLVAADGTLIGDDFDITAFGEIEGFEGQARDPDVAFSTAAGQFLVVFRGEAEEDVMDIWGQRVGVDGALIGEPFPVSRTGHFGEGEQEFVVGENGPPRVTYNATRGEWYAVWPFEGGFLARGFTNSGTGVYGQRVSAAGERLMEDDGRVSMTEDTPKELDVAHDARNDRFLVTWADDDVAFGRPVDGEGEPQGEGAFAVSSEGDEPVDGADPVVAWSPVTGEFLVAWEGESETNEKVIFAQRYSGVPAPIGDPFEVSEMEENREADRPDVAADANAAQFVVTWEGEIGGDPVIVDRGEDNDPWKEIHAQRIGGAGEELGGDFQVSAQRSEANPEFDAVRPALAYNGVTCRYLDVWEGWQSAPTEEEGGGKETEAFGRFIAAPSCPVAQQPVATVTQAASAAVPPATVTCLSRRRFRIRLREPRGKDRLRSASVRVAGKKVRLRRRGGRLTATVDLRGMRAGRVAVRITARTAKGRRLRGTRRYRTCTVKLPGGIPKL